MIFVLAGHHKLFWLSTYKYEAALDLHGSSSMYLCIREAFVISLAHIFESLNAPLPHTQK